MDELSTLEKSLMLVITGITNFICLPALYVLYQKRLVFQLHIAVFTMITSFMYHALDSVAWKSLYLSTGNWHKLDNIGSIMCFVCLAVYLMDNLQKRPNNVYVSSHTCDTDLHLHLIGLFLTITMQTSHPWELQNTIVPILIYFGLLLIKIAVYGGSRLNSYYSLRGGALLGIGVLCFSKGLDDRNDYLRIWHGLWHCSTGIASFYLWQMVDKDRELPNVVKYTKQQRYEFGPTIRQMLGIGKAINKDF